MRSILTHGLVGASLLLGACGAQPPRLVTAPGLSPEAHMAQWMQQRGVVGLAVAHIEAGVVQQTWALGQRSRERGEALGPDTVLYAASLTKPTLAWLVLQLVDEGRLDLDAPLTRLLPQPLPAYPEWSDLAGDARWQRLTPRWLLSHQSGLPNWREFTSNRRLHFDHEPGTRYAYSGEGIQILQTVLEQGLGLVVFNNGDERAWFKGGHDDYTGNFLLCLERGPRCVLMMSNDVRAEGLYPHIAELLLGPTRMPWRWEYGAQAP